MFESAEERMGASLARAFLGLIAVSRAGWREIDFRILLPRVSGEPWDELHFANLRRLFRGQMRQRGTLTQWDFNHAQMRAAVRARLAAKHIREEALHQIIADRLLSCQSDDPLRISETMVHLLGSQDWLRAANFYGNSSLTYPEAQGATTALVRVVIESPRTTDPKLEAQGLCNLLVAPGLDDPVIVLTAVRFILDLGDALEHVADLGPRLVVAEAARDALRKVVSAHPDKEWERSLAIAHS